MPEKVIIASSLGKDKVVTSSYTKTKQRTSFLYEYSFIEECTIVSWIPTVRLIGWILLVYFQETV